MVSITWGRFDIGQFQLLILHWAISVVNKSSLFGISIKNLHSFSANGHCFQISRDFVAT